MATQSPSLLPVSGLSSLYKYTASTKSGDVDIGSKVRKQVFLSVSVVILTLHPKDPASLIKAMDSPPRT